MPRLSGCHLLPMRGGDVVKKAEALDKIKSYFAPLRGERGDIDFIERDYAEQIIEQVVRSWGSWSWARPHSRDRRLDAQIRRVRAWAEKQWGPRLSDKIESAIIRICTSMVDWWFAPNAENYRQYLFWAWEELRT